ncbi:hypothetical protein N2152v2_003516 [Parachlorella kessleri]
MDNSEVLANFVAITGADEGTALQMLSSTDFQLEQAVNLFFAMEQQGPQGQGLGGGGGGLGGFGAGVGGGFDDVAGLAMDDGELARQLQREADAVPAEEQVRAPIPVRTERLYGDAPHRAHPTRRVDPVPHNVVDAFRDLGGDDEAAGSGQRLASMFEPPRELLFVGSFDEAKQQALEKQRWLLVNVQSTNQFASHQLNRDTWRDEMVKSLVENNFVFFQVYDVVEEAQKLMAYYRIYELPAVLVVDPVTGAPMRQWTGFVNAERMAEELMPFLDTSIHDPAASRLAAGLKRKKSSVKDMSQHGSGQALNEDEELQRALEMSMQDATGTGPSGSGAGASHSDEEDERAVLAALAAQQQEQVAQEAAAAALSPAQVAAEAAARLPPEPAGAEGCRIAVRFPDGKRGQRRFPRSAPLAAVHDYCLSQVEEAAAGRPFSLSQGFPGAPVLSTLQQSLEDAKVADAMLVMKWAS